MIHVPPRHVLITCARMVSLSALRVRQLVYTLLWLPALSSVAFPTVVAAVTWREYTNSHFHALSDAPEPEVLELLGDLERFRAAVQVVTGVRVPVDVPRDIVIVFRNRGEYLDYAPGYYAGGHIAKGDGQHPSVMLLPVDQMRIDSSHVIRHEFVHSLLVHHEIDFPRWYEEGLAEFLSTVLFEGDAVVVGLPPKDRFKQSLEVLSFEQIMAEGYNPHVRTVQYGDPYLQYWFLVDYLLLGSRARYTQLEDCLRLVHLGTPAVEAFSIAFGMSPQKFWDSELKSYAVNLRSRGRYKKVPIPAAYLDLDFRQTPMSTEDVQMLLDKLKPTA